MVLWIVFDLMVTSWGQVLGFWLLVWSTDRGSYSHQVLVKHWYLNDSVLLLLWFCGQYLNLMVTSWLWKHDTAITLVVSRIDVLFRAWHYQVWGFWLWLLVEVLTEDLLVLMNHYFVLFHLIRSSHLVIHIIARVNKTFPASLYQVSMLDEYCHACLKCSYFRVERPPHRQKKHISIAY